MSFDAEHDKVLKGSDPFFRALFHANTSSNNRPRESVLLPQTRGRNVEL